MKDNMVIIDQNLTDLQRTYNRVLEGTDTYMYVVEEIGESNQLPCTDGHYCAKSNPGHRVLTSKCFIILLYRPYILYLSVRNVCMLQVKC